MVVKGKHKEILVELLIYWFFINKEFNAVDKWQEMVIDIKEQNEYGKWYINHYIDKWGE